MLFLKKNSPEKAFPTSLKATFVFLSCYAPVVLRKP